MRLVAFAVEGFRSLRNLKTDLSGMTVAIGPNGSGKSSFLTAVKLLLDPSSTVIQADFTRGASGDQLGDEIKVEGSFDLAGAEVSDFDRLAIGSTLKISRTFAGPGKGDYRCIRKGIPSFAQVRSQSVGHKDAYNLLVERGAYEGLRRANSKQEAFERMDVWELDHPAQLEEVRDAFDRIEDVREKCSLIFVGATTDPLAEVQTSRGSLRLLLESIADLTAVDAEIKAAARESSEKVSAIVANQGTTLDRASNQVSTAISDLSPGVRIRIKWEPPRDLEASMPAMSVSVVGPDGLETELGHQGHGTQRSVLLGVFAALAEVERTGHLQRAFLLVIEEPEVFQHPLSARHLARTLFQLTDKGYQVLCSTHSPFFVQAQWLEGILLFSRAEDGQDSGTRISRLSLERIASSLETAAASAGFTAESTRARLLQIVDATKTEGLFARGVVLVEGVEDTALIRASGSIANAAFDESGIAIVSADGKTNLPLLTALFREASIPTYVLFDLDREGDVTEADRSAEAAILNLLSESSTRLEESVVHDSFACFRTTLADQVANEIGPRFEELFTAKRTDLGFKGDQGKKSQAVLESVLQELAQENLRSDTLSSLVEKVLLLAPSAPT